MQILECYNTIHNLLYVDLCYLENKKYVETRSENFVSTYFVNTSNWRYLF